MMKKFIFWLSIFLNFAFGIMFLWNKLNTPSNEFGILKEDIEVGNFMGNKTVFILPKGLTVSNQSERGIEAIGQFENKRFSIVISSDEELVDYNINKDSLNSNGNYYSADFKKFLNN